MGRREVHVRRATDGAAGRRRRRRRPWPHGGRGQGERAHGPDLGRGHRRAGRHRRPAAALHGPRCPRRRPRAAARALRRQQARVGVLRLARRRRPHRSARRARRGRGRGDRRGPRHRHRRHGGGPDRRLLRGRVRRGPAGALRRRPQRLPLVGRRCGRHDHLDRGRRVRGRAVRRADPRLAAGPAREFRGRHRHRDDPRRRRGARHARWPRCSAARPARASTAAWTGPPPTPSDHAPATRTAPARRPGPCVFSTGPPAPPTEPSRAAGRPRP